MKILAIETSCDDTSVAIMENMELLSHLFASQNHTKYGGIFPEYAARNHLKSLPALVELGINEANTRFNQIDVIAYTYAPGLLGSLMVGACYAKALSWSLQTKAVAVHHIEAHILAAQYDCGLEFPYGALVVSGGHTLLAIADGLGDYKVLGKSLDDACGECFDKVAREMGLPQPGGPAIERLAINGANSVILPIPLQNDGSCNFSFSGLKTSAIRATSISKPQDLAASLQHAIAKHILERLKNAIKLRPDVRNWALVGGVASNMYIRAYLTHSLSMVKRRLYCPRMEFCTDNAAMIGYTGFLYAIQNRFSNFTIEPRSRMSLEELDPIK